LNKPAVRAVWPTAYAESFCCSGDGAYGATGAEAVREACIGGHVCFCRDDENIHLSGGEGPDDRSFSILGLDSGLRIGVDRKQWLAAPVKVPF